MGTVGVRDLAEHASSVVAEVERTKQPTLVTRRGKPVALLVPVDEDDFYDYVLAKAPEFVASREEADEAIARGELGKPLDQVIAELDGETE